MTEFMSFSFCGIEPFRKNSAAGSCNESNKPIFRLCMEDDWLDQKR
jgi:hypothetical protein